MKRSGTLIVVILINAWFLMGQPANAQDIKLGAENFLIADADGDRVLAYEEFVIFIDLNAADGLGNAAMVSSRDIHAKAFERVDANDDGVASPQELQSIP